MGTLSGRLQGLVRTMLPPSQAQVSLHPLFPSKVSAQELVDAADNVATLVGHLRVEVDVGES